MQSVLSHFADRTVACYDTLRTISLEVRVLRRRESGRTFRDWVVGAAIVGRLAGGFGREGRHVGAGAIKMEGTSGTEVSDVSKRIPAAGRQGDYLCEFSRWRKASYAARRGL
jgi:hypothetical protein